MRVDLTFEEAVFGTKKEVTFRHIESCPDCKGTGSADGAVETCSQCRGSGQVRTTQNMMGMAFQTTSTCPSCNGKGKIIKTPCNTCKGKARIRKNKTVKLNVPAGVDTGNQMYGRGDGDAGVNGGPAGDVIFQFAVADHPFFDRHGTDVFCEVPVSFTQAALGGEIEVPTLEGTTKFPLPEGTQTGREFSLADMGIPYVNNPKRRGRLRFTVVVETPTKLSKEQKELLKKLEDSMDNKSTPKRKKFFDTIKDLFN